MEDYNHQLGENTNSRGNSSNFLYGPGPINLGSSAYGRTNPPAMSSFHLHQSGDCYDNGPIVKTEAGTSNAPRFHYASVVRGHHQNFQDHMRHQNDDQNNLPAGDVDAIKAKIIAHPQYSNLLEAYMDCQKVGAPPEVVARLTEVRQEFEARQRATAARDHDSKDPELDQFMEAYYDMLVKYREELTRPLQEAMEFMRRIETQLNMLTNGPDKCEVEGVGSSEDDQDQNSGGETGLPEIDPRAEDRELKNHLLKKYSGYLSSLKQESV
ncbi:hypothetical protein DH2020_035467 [Rehmannia glutinosa]|uniref:ELK domain-containing protein n=1 Tax=Rehmannia glutinosa TaxID=99300 RepID=A0ABR0V6G1_REHGL